MGLPRTARSLVAACVVVASACGGGGHVGTTPATADRTDEAVVHLSTECTGVLVGPSHVLTAAHCVEDPGPWTVRVGAERVWVAGCQVHPEAYRRARGCGQGRGWSVRDHDLAVLRLSHAVDVTPVPVLLTAPSLSDRWWQRQRVRAVGWDRRPAAVGPLSQRSGPNRIVSAPDRTFVTSPLGRAGFATVVGDSGGPALLDLRHGEAAVGILFGGPAPGSTDSVWVSLSEPSNARWLMRTLGPEFAADLAHLDPDSPWDPADWTELGWRLRARAPNPMDRANAVRTVSP
ncbi:MAG: trypsin-like serine protease [Sandaracinaceae bacterium]